MATLAKQIADESKTTFKVNDSYNNDNEQSEKYIYNDEDSIIDLIVNLSVQVAAQAITKPVYCSYELPA